MSTPPRLYDLLPAFIRFRDAYEGEPLKTVMDALEVPFQVIRDDIDNLYRAWFIETCDEWMVPYIGDLVGVRGLETQRQMLPTQRTRVANTLAYARSKGTAAALERVARDVTGWPCRVIEHSRTMAGAASVLDTARLHPGTVDLRQAGGLDTLGGPFNTLSHSVDLKPADPSNPPLGDQGGFHPLQLGVTFWRLESYPILGGTPHAAEGTGGRGFRFHPFGLDIPLFNPPQTANGPVYASSERNLPVRLRPFPLAEEIAAHRRGDLPPDGYFGIDPVFRFLAKGVEGLVPIPPEAIEICDLSAWQRTGGKEVRVFVDPVLGRFLLAKEPRLEEQRHPVLVDYSYGLSMDLGGGPYPRNLEIREPVEAAWKAVVSRDCLPGFDARTREHRFQSLDAAVDAWSSVRALPIPARQSEAMAPRSGIIRIHDSATYEVDLKISLKGRWLAIQAADGCCPCVRGDLEVIGAIQETTQGWSDVRRLMEIPGEDPSLQNQLRLDGLWIEGGIRVRGGASLLLEHCTVAPPFPGRPAATAVFFDLNEARGFTVQGERSVVRARRCILGSLDLGHRPVELELIDSIVDGGRGTAIAGSLTAAVLARCTVFGEVRVDRLSHGVTVLFRDPVHVAVPSEGELRFCHVPAGSVTPTQERCRDAGAAFTSVTYGDPAYAQLSPAASAGIRQGGEDGNEIGVYNSLRQADRLANLPPVLEEFLPWGMSARISFVT